MNSWADPITSFELIQKRHEEQALAPSLRRLVLRIFRVGGKPTAELDWIEIRNAILPISTTDQISTDFTVRIPNHTVMTGQLSVSRGGPVIINGDPQESSGSGSGAGPVIINGNSAGN